MARFAGDGRGFRHLGDADVHQGHVWKVVVADFESDDGHRFRRDIVRSPGAVGVVPLVFDAEGLASVVLISQYRPPYEGAVIEIPAGMRDVPGEPAEETGRRELAEEAGLVAGQMAHLVDILPSPGMTDSVCSIFLATDCTPADHDRQGPEEQSMELLHVPLDDALAMIDRGEIADAKTVAGLFAADRQLRRGG
ncbi:MAG: NUDIX hydrolase [Ilumatobacter sp.]|uniref:NUDIX domain-containing protein n=1 Tax=Ilumatobacter sp. TaxID=1967498 RepID=UPI0026144184|nr:NUDIX hydrolase [Ilumatobacter sp.]MDJ0771259.1 NUDIX hydrolase [Ilumatobacter sp.]